MEEENEEEMKIKEYKKQDLNNMVEMFRYYDKCEKVKNENVTLAAKIEDLSTREIDESELQRKKIRIEEQEEEKGQLDASIRTLRQEIIDLDKKTVEDYHSKKVEYQKKIDETEAKIKELEEKLRDINEFEATKEDIKAKIQGLEDALAKEKEDRAKDIQIKEKEKIEATEKLRKEMLYKIKETKAQLLSLNDAQLQNTTKLTIQQNHQLTSELEFQSKQTETLLYKNNKMSEQIVTLKKDIEIHKQVENELAKRSHFCQKVIKKLNQKIKELKQEIEDAKKAKTTKPEKTEKKEDKWDEKNKEELISFLEGKLEEIQKKLENTQKKYKQLIEKLYKSREKYKRTALLLTDYLDDLLNSSDGVLSSEQDMHLNLDEIKEAKVPIKDLQPKDKIALILVLLKQLQPYLSDYVPEHPAALELDHNQKSDADTAETLNRILNNIKVQTKRSELGSRGKDGQM